MFSHSTVQFHLSTWRPISTRKSDTVSVEAVPLKGRTSGPDPAASQVHARGRSGRATDNRTSHPALWEHSKHCESLENSHGHHVMPRECRHDLPLINARWLYFKVLFLCPTTGCQTNHKCYQHACVYLSSGWLKCDVPHNTVLVWYATEIADLPWLVSQVVTWLIILNHCSASEDNGIGQKHHPHNLKREKR